MKIGLLLNKSEDIRKLRNLLYKVRFNFSIKFTAHSINEIEYMIKREFELIDLFISEVRVGGKSVPELLLRFKIYSPVIYVLKENEKLSKDIFQNNCIGIIEGRINQKILNHQLNKYIKLREKILLKENVADINILKNDEKAKLEKSTKYPIFDKKNGSYRFIDINDISHVTGKSKIILIYDNKGKKYIEFQKNLAQVYRRLNKELFMKVNQNTIINRKSVEVIETKNGIQYIKLKEVNEKIIIGEKVSKIFKLWYKRKKDQD